jgi:hypothetical protein
MNAPATGQIHLVIMGATGMVGGYALRYALDHPSVGVVTVIGRRKLDISHPKLKEVPHRDFTDLLGPRKAAVRSGRGDFLPGRLYGRGVRRGVPQDHRRLYDRVRARSARQQPRRGLLIPERERR